MNTTAKNAAIRRMLDQIGPPLVDESVNLADVLPVLTTSERDRLAEYAGSVVSPLQFQAIAGIVGRAAARLHNGTKET